MGLLQRLAGFFRSRGSKDTQVNENRGGKLPEGGGKPTFDRVFEYLRDNGDLVHRSFPENGTDVLYFGEMAGAEELDRDVIRPFRNVTPDKVAERLESPIYAKTSTAAEVIGGIASGMAGIFFDGEAYLADVKSVPSRKVEKSEHESVLAGPDESFSESARINLAVLRRRLKSPRLKAIHLHVGEISRTDVFVLYIEGIANPSLVDDLVRRIQAVEVDDLQETNVLAQIIDDNPNSIFPQFLTTERPDSVASRLSAGRIVALVNGSPNVLVAPAAFIDFFSTAEDFYLRWVVSTCLRMLRFFAFAITISFTAFYVAITTFHYEMIPRTMLINLAESRARVPFPPLYEALIMEFVIEMLREAGARLPTKIGQTIGIVGGIVIGQASVQAGFTSNILIITVASSAIASFVIPSYSMSTSIRMLRFGLIFLAGVWGNLGLMMGICLIVIHLSGLTSLGTSYLVPLSPFNPKDMKKLIIRAPFWTIRERPSQTMTDNPVQGKPNHQEGKRSS